MYFVPPFTIVFCTHQRSVNRVYVCMYTDTQVTDIVADSIQPSKHHEVFRAQHSRFKITNGFGSKYYLTHQHSNQLICVRVRVIVLFVSLNRAGLFIMLCLCWLFSAIFMQIFVVGIVNILLFFISSNIASVFPILFVNDIHISFRR